MKPFMSRMAIFAALAAVALVCRRKGCSRQPAGGLGAGGGEVGLAFGKPRVPPPSPSSEPANAVREQARSPSASVVRPPPVVPASAQVRRALVAAAAFRALREIEGR